MAAAIAMAIGLMSAFMLAGPRDAGAEGNPEFVAGNPSCEDLGYVYEFKIDNTPDNGNYDNGTLFVTISNVSVDGKSFDWTSNILVDAVIVKGGAGGSGVAGSNVYYYEPDGSMGDSNLISPNDTQISHVSFCYSPRLEVSKTADTSFTRTYEWEIKKTVSPGTLNLFTGDTGEVEYTVEVEKTTTDSAWAVSGTISIYNPGPGSANITGVSDVVADGIAANNVDCVVQFPYELAEGDTLKCDYDADLPNAETRLNTATVSVAANSAVKGGSGTADVMFGDPTTEVNKTINVTDTYEYAGGPWTFSDTGSVSYTRTFACDDDAGKNSNTATIVETGQFASADVTVNCYALLVTKDATTSLDRTWTWDIDKSATWVDTFGATNVADTVTLLAGNTLNVDYLLEISATSKFSDWAVSGTIWVNNPAPIDALINDVSDIVSPDIAASVDCGVTFPYTLAAKGTLKCTYSAGLPNAEPRLNTATATLQNYDYDKYGVGEESGTTDFSGKADVIFNASSVNEIDACVDLTDVFADSEIDVAAGNVDQTICAEYLVGGKYNVEYTVTLTVPADLVCSTYYVNNTATIVTVDNGTEHSDGWTVIVNVPCDTCTLTQGYWKTHSDYGPAKKADATWLMLANGPDTTFFLSGESYYNVLWTAPRGNAYYNLAHQYIAAELNGLNGADLSDVADEMAEAKLLFETYTPAGVAALKRNDADRAKFIKLAYTLDQYNNGLIGPGHCSEQ